jgi:pSer/pThr/pTyr-binding forkhead associated (FHA) protein
MKEIRIGRHPDNDVILSENTVSKFHAILLIDGDTYIINDLNSRNGIYVNGTRIKGSAQLDILDIVKLGTALFAWKNHIYDSQVEERSTESEPVQPEQVVFSPKGEKKKGFIPFIIISVVIAFLGIAYLITTGENNTKKKDKGVKTTTANASSNEVNSDKKKDTLKTEKPQPQVTPQTNTTTQAPPPKEEKKSIELSTGEFWSGFDYVSKVFNYNGILYFEMTSAYNDNKALYYQTSKNNNYLTVYSEDYQETLKILVISNKSFRIIDGDYWIEECPYKINGTYYK